MPDSASTSGLRIDVNDATDLPLAESSRFAVRAEELGFSGVGMPDHHHTGRDVFVRLVLAAQQTTRVTLFPSVTNPISRNPKVLASLAATLAESAPGRACLMIGSGDLAVKYLREPGATASRLADAAETVRRTLDSEFTLAAPVPVYINASSPRMLAAAGAAADGVYAMVGVDPEVVAAAMDHVAAGAREAQRDADSIPVALGLPVFMADSPEQAYESAARYALSGLLNRNRVYSRLMRERMPSLEDVSQVSDLSTEQLHRLVDAMVAHGTPQQAAAQALAFAERAPTRHFIARVQFAGEDPVRAIEVFVSALRAAGGENVLYPPD
ncbi:MAG: LLM class flavin-dependent oxidoreductase [Chloroflexota bacterium]|nr:LLM class flavin-dependent oxidoreductase [Chloroflexota bacterium]